MKRTRSILAAALAFAAVLAVGSVAFATEAPDYSVTIVNENNLVSIDGRQYQAYKIFNVSTSDDGDAVAYTFPEDSKFYQDSSAKSVIEAHLDLTGPAADGSYSVVPKAGDMDDEDAASIFAVEFLKVLQNGSFDADATAVASGETAYLDLNASGPGYYMITAPTAENPDPNAFVIATLTISAVQPTAQIIPKPEVPTLDKTIASADEVINGKAAASDIGSDVGFEISSVVPYMGGYASYVFQVKDTLSAGLSFNDDVEVLIGGKQYTDFTVSVSGQTFTVDFPNFISQKDNYGKPVVITYSATLTEQCLVADAESNRAVLTYSDDISDSSHTTTTPPEICFVYDFDIAIDKLASSSGKKLAGAAFVLKNEAGEYYAFDGKAVSWVTDISQAKEVVTDSNGFASFQGLALVPEATYFLTETKAPKGYNKLKQDQPVQLFVGVDPETGIITETEGIMSDDEHGQYYLIAIVENKAGHELPITGGAGAIASLVVGIGLILAAAVVLISRRRSHVTA